MTDEQHATVVRSFMLFDMRTAAEFMGEVEAIKTRLAYLREIVPGLRDETYAPGAYDDVCQTLAQPL